jgi:2-polyprenyl-3-methyl-5-hydroxy-6-metoxy-1,4-benzoquinol methylase
MVYKKSLEDGPLVRMKGMRAEVTERQYKLWKMYADAFKRRWGFYEELSEFIGISGGDVFEAEFQEHGPICYSNSVALPVRNALYQMFLIATRWPRLREMGLAAPILDYGSGVGYTSLWLWSKGYQDLYCYEPPGIQREIMEDVFKDLPNISVWDENTPAHFSTVLCTNVLEHAEDPLGLLNKLYGLGSRVIADVCIDRDDEPQTPHVAPKNDLRKCQDILLENRGLYEEKGLGRNHHGIWPKA